MTPTSRAFLRYALCHAPFLLQEEQQPGDVAGLAAAVVRRYGPQLWRHYASFRYTLNSFNLLQARASTGSFPYA